MARITINWKEFDKIRFGEVAEHDHFPCDYEDELEHMEKMLCKAVVTWVRTLVHSAIKSACRQKPPLNREQFMKYVILKVLRALTRKLK